MTISVRNLPCKKSSLLWLSKQKVFTVIYSEVFLNNVIELNAVFLLIVE